MHTNVGRNLLLKKYIYYLLPLLFVNSGKPEHGRRAHMQKCVAGRGDAESGGSRVERSEVKRATTMDVRAQREGRGDNVIPIKLV